MPEGKEDVTGIKIIKILRFLEKELAPFLVVKTGYVWDKSPIASIHLEFRQKQRPAQEIRAGPPLDLISFVAEFKKKNKETYVDQNRIMARVTISKTTLLENVKQCFNADYITEKIVGVRDITIV